MNGNYYHFIIIIITDLLQNNSQFYMTRIPSFKYFELFRCQNTITKFENKFIFV